MRSTLPELDAAAKRCGSVVACSASKSFTVSPLQLRSSDAAARTAGCPLSRRPCLVVCSRLQTKPIVDIKQSRGSQADDRWCSAAARQQKAAWLGFSVLVKGQALVSWLVADSREASRQRIERIRKELVCRHMVQRRQGEKIGSLPAGQSTGRLEARLLLGGGAASTPSRAGRLTTVACLHAWRGCRARRCRLAAGQPGCCRRWIAPAPPGGRRRGAPAWSAQAARCALGHPAAGKAPHHSAPGLAAAAAARGGLRRRPEGGCSSTAAPPPRSVAASAGSQARERGGGGARGQVGIRAPVQTGEGHSSSAAAGGPSKKGAPATSRQQRSLLHTCCTETSSRPRIAACRKE
jgi:hypothetical protein